MPQSFFCRTRWGVLLMAAVLSGVSAYLCIHLFLKLLDRIGLLPFVAYRIVLGLVLFWVLAG